MQEQLGIAGTGTIACGLAAAAARHGRVLMWARSSKSADHALDTVRTLCHKLEGHDPGQVKVVHDLEQLAGASFVIEAIVEDLPIKSALLAELGRRCAQDTILATTTSSLSVQALGDTCGYPERLVALHVFNPVTKMKLVELAYPRQTPDATRQRARELSRTLGKTPVEVPDLPGFVVNRLLFPYLFSAVRLLEATGLSAEDLDACMTLGAGHPLGPLGLLDLVGLDVARAIGEALEEPIPARLQELVDEGALGRKSRRGFHRY